MSRIEFDGTGREVEVCDDCDREVKACWCVQDKYLQDEEPNADDFAPDGFASFAEWWDYQTDCLEYEQRRHDEEVEHWAASQ